MSDAVVSNAAAPSAPAQAGTPKKQAASKKPRVKPAHPRTSDMVNAAVKNLKERGGSSLQAIKKYISANYKVDAEKLAPFIKKYLKSAVTTGALVQTKGKGASGSFKLSTAEKGEPKKKVKSSSAATKTKKAASVGAKAKTSKATKPAKPAAKKLTASKKSTTAAAAATAAGKKSATVATKKATAAAAKPAKSPAKPKPSKAKKPAKGSPTKKPKTPKPKKAAAKPKSAATKKAAPAKKK